MKTRHTRFSFRKAICCFCAAALLLPALAGCSSSGSRGGTVQAAAKQVQSVETSVSLEMRGNVSGGAHTVSLRSDGTITSTLTPAPSYHTEFYSSILVDGATTRESREYYVVPKDSGYIRYEHIADTDEWNSATLGRADALSVARQTGFFYDWSEIMAGLTSQNNETLTDGSKRHYYSGTVPTYVFQELFGNNVFGSFMYSVEQLLQDTVPCTLTVNGDTMLPETLEIDFSNSWTVSDMYFDTAYIVVTYSDWNKTEEIEVPKRVSVGANDTEAEFYSTFYAWNLFLPYVGGQISGDTGIGTGDQSFAASWNTFQVRIDGSMAKVPLPYEDLKKVGYTIDEQYASIIMEPNKYRDGIAVVKGADKMYCTFYNDDTVAQPITKCKIGCIDLSASDLPENGIQLFLPEVTLGITKEALISAYGEPTESSTSFSCDTYLWKGDNDLQSFMAEVSPVTGKVIRLQLRNIPVTGGPQS